MRRKAASGTRQCPPKPTPDLLLLPRVLTAAALLAAFLSALWFLEQPAFALVATAIVALGGYEWACLGKARAAIAWAYALACALLAFGAIQLPFAVPWICGGAIVFWALVVPPWLALGFKATPAVLMLIAGIIVLVPAGLALATLGRGQVLMLLGLVWIADTAAFLAGRAFGKHPLAASISPAKTWEGVAGAAVATVLYAIILGVVDPGLAARVHGTAWVPYLAGAALLCAASVVGDLFESAAKRRAGVKDSGSLLPGHGGVLDRIDSATATLPVALLLMQTIGPT